MSHFIKRYWLFFVLGVIAYEILAKDKTTGGAPEAGFSVQDEGGN